MCTCVYCKKAGKGVVDFGKAVVGMTEKDASLFLRDHKVFYTIIRRDRKYPSMIKTANYVLYVEIGGSHVIAAYNHPPRWDR